MNPAMILSWIFGGLLINSIGVENFDHFWDSSGSDKAGASCSAFAPAFRC